MYKENEVLESYFQIIRLNILSLKQPITDKHALTHTHFYTHIRSCTRTHTYTQNTTHTHTYTRRTCVANTDRQETVINNKKTWVKV